MKIDTVADILGDLIKVPLILFGDNDVLDLASPMHYPGENIDLKDLYISCKSRYCIHMIKKNGSMEQLIADGYSEAEDLNCGETTFYAADRVYGFGLSPEVLKLSAAFGGGMGDERTCGAIAGGLMAVSHLFVKERGHADDSFKKINHEIFRRVEEELGSVDCKPLKEKYRTEEEGCHEVKRRISGIVESVIDREFKKRSSN